MTSKLTLSVEKQVIEKAKVYARNTGGSLSAIVETYLKSLTSENPKESLTHISPELKELIGIVELPKEFNEKELMRKYLNDKYL